MKTEYLKELISILEPNKNRQKYKDFVSSEYYKSLSKKEQSIVDEMEFSYACYETILSYGAEKDNSVSIIHRAIKNYLNYNYSEFFIDTEKLNYSVYSPREVVTTLGAKKVEKIIIQKCFDAVNNQVNINEMYDTVNKEQINYLVDMLENSTSNSDRSFVMEQIIDIFCSMVVETTFNKDHQEAFLNNKKYFKSM